jgi:hypothetical protein
MNGIAHCVRIWAVFLFFLTSLASAVTYSGSLSGAADGNGGLITTGPWSSTSTVLSWVVDDETVPGFWAYSYTFSVPSKDISHMLIEASPSFTDANILSSNWPSDDVEVDTWNGQGNSNPLIPASLYGIKFDEISDESVTVDFVSDRAPVWGDFYAKDGVVDIEGTKISVVAWNAGFTDTDPTDAPSNGSLNYHILVPDTNGTPPPVVPEPVTMLGALMGCLGIGRYLRKR